jgi:hypothetical protein
MAVAALIVSIVAALAAVAAAVYARRLDEAAKEAVKAAKRSAVAAEDRTAVESARRHEELTPRFRVSLLGRLSDGKSVQLVVFLAGPPDLERLDSLTIVIRDDATLREIGKLVASADGPARVVEGAQAALAAEAIWGPYRFAYASSEQDARRRLAGRVPVGEQYGVTLEAARVPQAWPLPWPGVRSVRLQLECWRAGLEPWTLACEVGAERFPSTVEVP